MNNNNNNNNIPTMVIILIAIKKQFIFHKKQAVPIIDRVQCTGRIKSANNNSDTIFNIKPGGSHSHKCFSSNILTFKRIWRFPFCLWMSRKHHWQNDRDLGLRNAETSLLAYLAQSVQIFCRYFCSYSNDVGRYQ